MDYLYYIAAVLILGVACIAAIRLFTANSKETPTLSEEAKRRAMPAAKFAAGNRKPERPSDTARPAAPIIARELQRTPTPWGWANHKTNNRPDAERTGLSAAMQSLTDRLVREKTLVNGSRDPRADGSLRALLEDRYAPVNKEHMTEVEFTKVKRPLLRDPSEPHDQMDNFGSRDAGRIRTKVGPVAVVAPPGKSATARREEDFRYIEIKDVKQPWGW